MRRSLRFKLVGVVAIVFGAMAISASVAVAAVGAARSDDAAIDGRKSLRPPNRCPLRPRRS